MPKKVFAVTNVRVGPAEDQYFAAGDVIDPTKFTKEQLLELHAAGAVEVRVVDEEVAPDGTAVAEVVSEEASTEAAATTDEGSAGDSGAGEEPTTTDTTP